MITKDDAAETLIQWHFHLDDELTEIYRFLAPDEDAPGEPIKLLEVSPDTWETGAVGPYSFAGAGDIPYVSSVALVSQAEMTQVKEGKIPLPPGWSLDTARPYLREMHTNGKK